MIFQFYRDCKGKSKGGIGLNLSTLGVDRDLWVLSDDLY